MSDRSNQDKNKAFREIIGLGDFSSKKNYYSELQNKVDELENERNKFRQIFYGSRVPTVILDKDSLKFIDCNQAAVEIYGFETKEQIIGLTPSDVSDEHQYDGSLSSSAEHNPAKIAIEKGMHVFEWRHKRPNGTVWDAEVTLMSFFSDGNTYLQFTLSDITEKKKALENLKSAENYIKEIINSMPSAIIAINRKALIQRVNNEAKKLSARECVHDAPLTLCFPELESDTIAISRFLNTRETVFLKRVTFSSTTPSIKKDIVIYPLGSGLEDELVIRIDDVSEQVKLEEMMIQAEKMLTIGGLAAGMAHEINNPLAGMIQTAEVIMNRISPDKKANLRAANELNLPLEGIREYLEERGIIRMLNAIRESGARAGEIVKNMLTFARKSNNKKEEHNLQNLILETIDLASTDFSMNKGIDFKNIDIEKTFHPNPSMIKCEYSKVQQVFLNLLKNGAEAMITETPDKKHLFRIETSEDENYFITKLTDNGPGMDKNTQRHVFEPFFTTKDVGHGTGLGLSVSYFIISEHHNGKMEVESVPGEGTSFIIKLPLHGQ